MFDSTPKESPATRHEAKVTGPVHQGMSQIDAGASLAQNQAASQARIAKAKGAGSPGASKPAGGSLVREVRQEARVDSRLIAQSLGNQHKNVCALIDQHSEYLKRFGHLPFETRMVKRKQGGGKPERYYLLNEDQAYFLLSLSRNTPRVVDLKAKLVMAFREARLKASMRQEYLPQYRALHEQVHALADGSANKKWVHANINQLINRAAGIEPGQRPQADAPHTAMLVAAQHLALRAMQGAVDHRQGYARAKQALQALAGKPAALGMGGVA